MAKITVTLVESTTKEIEVPNVVYRACKSAVTGSIIAYYKASSEQNEMVTISPSIKNLCKSVFLENILFGENTFDIEPEEFYVAYSKIMLQIESFVGLERLELKDAQDGPY